MHQLENNLLDNNEIPVPTLTIDAWTDETSAGGLVEKGVTLRWELPEGVDAMMVEVDGASWGPYLEPEKTLNIAYTDDPDRLANEDPVKVKLFYIKFGTTLNLNVLPISDEINLVLDDIVIMRSGLGTSKDDFCPLAQYPTTLTPVFSQGFGYWAMKYSDKYSGNGKYRAIRITISNDSTTVSCVLRPDTANSGIDELLTTDFCDTDLRGAFTEQEADGQKFVETTDFSGHTLRIKSYRDTDQDEVVIRVYGIDSTFTVGAKLHENS